MVRPVVVSNMEPRHEVLAGLVERVTYHNPGYCHVNDCAREVWLDRASRGGDLTPTGERLRPEFAKAAAGGQVALDIEVVVDGGMGGKEPLGRAW